MAPSIFKTNRWTPSVSPDQTYIYTWAPTFDDEIFLPSSIYDHGAV